MSLYPGGRGSSGGGGPAAAAAGGAAGAAVAAGGGTTASPDVGPGLAGEAATPLGVREEACGVPLLDVLDDEDGATGAAALMASTSLERVRGLAPPASPATAPFALALLFATAGEPLARLLSPSPLPSPNSPFALKKKPNTDMQINYELENVYHSVAKEWENDCKTLCDYCDKGLRYDLPVSVAVGQQ